MADRVVRDHFWSDARIAALPPDAPLLLIALFGYANDFGVFAYDPEGMRGTIRILRRWTLPRIKKCLNEIEKQLLFFRFEVPGEQYAYFINWEKHQKFDHDYRKKTAFPFPRVEQIQQWRELRGYDTSTTPDYSRAITERYPESFGKIPGKFRESSGNNPGCFRDQFESESKHELRGGSKKDLGDHLPRASQVPKGETPTPPSAAAKKAKDDPVPLDEIAGLWNRAAKNGGLAEFPKKPSSKLLDLIARRWRLGSGTVDERLGDFWSTFRIAHKVGRGWRERKKDVSWLTLRWILSDPEHEAKLREGQYGLGESDLQEGST